MRPSTVFHPPPPTLRVRVNPVRLVEIIDLHGKTVPEFAKDVGVSPTTIYKALQGRELGFKARRKLLAWIKENFGDCVWGDLFTADGYDAPRGVPGG